jgi:hypothetical protein
VAPRPWIIGYRGLRHIRPIIRGLRF